MSFIVKGVDLPKHYEAVEIKVYLPVIDGYTKCIQEVSALFSGEALNNIIQIPKDHGNIIDGNELKSIKSIQSADFNSIETIQKWIDNTPTILDKERE